MLASWDDVLGPSKTDRTQAARSVAELETERWWRTEADEKDEAGEEEGDDEKNERERERERERRLEPEPEPEPEPAQVPELEPKVKLKPESEPELEPHEPPKPHEPEPEPAPEAGEERSRRRRQEEPEPEATGLVAQVGSVLLRRSPRAAGLTKAVCTALRTAQYPADEWVSVLTQMPAATLEGLVDAVEAEEARAAGSSSVPQPQSQLEPEPEPEPEPEEPGATPKDDEAALVAKLEQLREAFARGALGEADFVAAHLQLAGNSAAALEHATVEAARALESAQTARDVAAILAAAPAGVVSQPLPAGWWQATGGGQRLLHHAAATRRSVEVLSAVLAADSAAASVADSSGRHPLHWVAASRPSARRCYECCSLPIQMRPAWLTARACCRHSWRCRVAAALRWCHCCWRQPQWHSCPTRP